MINSMISSNYPDDGERIDIGGWYNIDMEHVMAAKPSSKIPTDLSRYNIIYMSKLPYLEIMNNDDVSSSLLFTLSQYTTPKCPMTSLCIACRDTIRDSVHSCTKFDLSNDADVFACRSFERYFDLTLGEEVFVSGNNLTLYEKNEDCFFYHCCPPAAAAGAAVTHCGSGGKDMASLHSEAL